MTDTRTAWAEVANHMEALCLKLKLHAEQELSDEELRDKAGLDRIAATLAETAEAIENAYEDEAVRHDAREIARSFLDAADATVRNVGERLRSST